MCLDFPTSVCRWRHLWLNVVSPYKQNKMSVRCGPEVVKLGWGQCKTRLRVTTKAAGLCAFCPIMRFQNVFQKGSCPSLLGNQVSQFPEDDWYFIFISVCVNLGTWPRECSGDLGTTVSVFLMKCSSMVTYLMHSQVPPNNSVAPMNHHACCLVVWHQSWN